jgi:hypothetical protein
MCTEFSWENIMESGHFEDEECDIKMDLKGKKGKVLPLLN